MPSPQLPLILSALRARSATRHTLSVPESRAAFEELARVCPLAADVAIEQGELGGVPVEWLAAPGAEAGRVLFYLHGGAYVIGSLRTHRDLASRLAREAAARALTIGYRLAPEHPFPAALDDALAAYRALLGAGQAPEKLAVAGDSAGGGLALGLLVRVREEGLPLPAAALLMSPSVDLEGTGASMETKAVADPLISRRFLIETAAHYLAGADPRHPWASPLHAELTRLPPLLIQVGESETLLDDATRLAERARTAGVRVELRVWEAMFHGWQLYARMLPEGRQAIAEAGTFLSKELA